MPTAGGVAQCYRYDSTTNTFGHGTGRLVGQEQEGTDEGTTVLSRMFPGCAVCASRLVFLCDVLMGALSESALGQPRCATLCSFRAAPTAGRSEARQEAYALSHRAPEQFRRAGGHEPSQLQADEFRPVGRPAFVHALVTPHARLSRNSRLLCARSLSLSLSLSLSRTVF